MVTGARSRPNQLMFAAGSRHSPVAPTHRGRPEKNEQPRTIAGFTPSAIMSPGSAKPVHPDKAGRPWRALVFSRHACHTEEGALMT
jgi:hypothetical protein